MRRVRRDIAVDLDGDVVHVEQQMVAGRDRRRPLHDGNVLHQRHDMACAGLFDGCVQAGE